MKITPRSFLSNYLVIAALALGSIPAFSQVSLSVDIAPPPLAVYEQPACPDDGYLWTPGYWARGDDGYYWVPGAWVQPPQVGVLWTPCYWGWGGNSYEFHSGYWGANVGFYGGVNYGYGYGGHGYGGGRWDRGHFSYNTAVSNVSTTNIHNTYVDRTVINRNTTNVSYNGGKGGVQAQPTAQERQYTHQRHIQPTLAQRTHIRAAAHDRAQLASVNGGRPATTAVAKPEAYKRVVQQKTATRPITHEDKPKTRPVVPVKSSPAESKPPVKEEKPSAPVIHHAPVTESHSQEKPQEKPAAPVHHETPAKTESHSEKPAKPDDKSDKPQSN